MPKKDLLKPKSKSKRGGARPGAGRKKGSLEPHTIAARKAKERFIQRTAKVADKLFNAQLNKAIGETYLIRKVTERGPKGGVIGVHHEVVTDPRTIVAYLDSEQDGSFGGEDEWFYMTTKAADNSAIADMLNRGLGKPTDVIEADVTSGGERLISVNENQLTQLIRARAERSDT